MGKKRQGGLKTYSVCGYVTASVFKEIKAANEKEAREKFEALAVPGLCHQCSGAGEGSKNEVDFNGFDDEVHVTDVEEIK